MRPAETARRLAGASLSPNTRRAYAAALRRLDAWLAGRVLDDAALVGVSRHGVLGSGAFASLIGGSPGAAS